MFLQMEKRASKLDQTLVEKMIRSAVTEPEILEHVVRFVIALCIEAREITRVARIKGSARHGELIEEVADTIALFHRAGKRRRTMVTVL